MSELYIQELEQENDRLRLALENAVKLLADNWSDSLTVGLVPGLHFEYLSNEDTIQNRTIKSKKSFRSLRLLREYILSLNTKRKITCIVPQKSGDGRIRIYYESTIMDGDGQPITVYILEFRE